MKRCYTTTIITTTLPFLHNNALQGTIKADGRTMHVFTFVLYFYDASFYSRKYKEQTEC